MWYYDISFERVEDSPGWVCLERIYCFDWDAMEKPLYEKWVEELGRTPRFVGWHPQDGWFWISGNRDSATGFLNAGVEPSGLHLDGFTTESDLTEIHDALMAMGDRFPCRVEPT